MGMRDQITIDAVASKARALDFKFTVLGKGGYRLIYSPAGRTTAFGYFGNLAGCWAYMQGWSEARDEVASR